MASPITDKDAVWAIDAVMNNLSAAVHNGANEHARTMMAYAENVAGMAFSNSGLGMVHAMAHALGGHYNLPHGICNAVLLPYVLSFDSERMAFEDRFTTVAKAMGVHTPAEVIDCITKLNADIGIPAQLSKLEGVKPEDFKELAALAMHDTCMAGNLVPVTNQDVIAVYAAAYGG